MKEIWFNGTNSAEEREKVKQDFALAYNAFKRLSKILAYKRKLDSSSQDYNKASWPFYQADNNGYNRALTEVLSLLEGD